jgi:hypothetical protein
VLGAVEAHDISMREATPLRRGVRLRRATSSKELRAAMGLRPATAYKAHQYLASQPSSKGKAVAKGW